MDETSGEGMPKAARDLASAVLRWAEVDDRVAKEGWTVDNESDWDEAKVSMVRIAMEVNDENKVSDRGE